MEVTRHDNEIEKIKLKKENDEKESGMTKAKGATPLVPCSVY